jgi:catechol 2,3-dioxygenase-like lactoylglutathione lyase family enzyme
MKRLHVHIGVKDIEAATRYYTALFGAEPVKVKDDYVKWAPDDLAVNFAVSTTCGDGGVGHLGVELPEDGELAHMTARLDGVEAPVRHDGEVSCCYAKSKKAWAEDPEGVKWELFHTYGEADQLAPAFLTDKGERGSDAPFA